MCRKLIAKVMVVNVLLPSSLLSSIATSAYFDSIKESAGSDCLSKIY